MAELSIDDWSRGIIHNGLIFRLKNLNRLLAVGRKIFQPESPVEDSSWQS
jgi:hypothetical protein